MRTSSPLTGTSAGASSRTRPSVRLSGTTSQLAAWYARIQGSVRSSGDSRKPSSAARSSKRKEAIGPSELEELFVLLVRTSGVPSPVREHRFHPTRKWRFDFAWPDHKLAVEIEGGIWRKKGAHSGGAAITRDCEKSNDAQLAGWRVLRFVRKHLDDGTAVTLTRRALGLG